MRCGIPSTSHANGHSALPDFSHFPLSATCNWNQLPSRAGKTSAWRQPEVPAGPNLDKECHPPVRVKHQARIYGHGCLFDVPCLWRACIRGTALNADLTDKTATAFPLQSILCAEIA